MKIKFKIWLSQSTFPLQLVDCTHKSLPLTPTCVFATKIPSTVPVYLHSFQQFPVIVPVDLPLQVLSPVLVFAHTFPCGLVKACPHIPM